MNLLSVRTLNTVAVLWKPSLLSPSSQGESMEREVADFSCFSVHLVVFQVRQGTRRVEKKSTNAKKTKRIFQQLELSLCMRLGNSLANATKANRHQGRVQKVIQRQESYVYIRIHTCTRRSKTQAHCLHLYGHAHTHTYRYLYRSSYLRALACTFVQMLGARYLCSG